MMGERTRRRVIVRGRVQGVWFRDSCVREAASRAVTGWVRNREDGAVEAVFEGSPRQVEALISWCRTGPPRARVDAVEVLSEPVEGLAGFRIVG